MEIVGIHELLHSYGYNYLIYQHLVQNISNELEDRTGKIKSILNDIYDRSIDLKDIIHEKIEELLSFLKGKDVIFYQVVYTDKVIKTSRGTIVNDKNFFFISEEDVFIRIVTESGNKRNINLKNITLIEENKDSKIYNIDAVGNIIIN